jgi:hypothetical protein
MKTVRILPARAMKEAGHILQGFHDKSDKLRKIVGLILSSYKIHGSAEHGRHQSYLS